MRLYTVAIFNEFRQDVHTMPTEAEIAASNGLAASIMQVAPWFKKQMDKLQPLVDQPVIRFPWVMPLATSQVIPAGANNVPLLAADFQLGLEYPFEVHQIKFSQDASHTFRDWRAAILDGTFAQNMQNNPAMVALLVDNNTGAWKMDPFPWIIRPKGGTTQIRVDNLDTVNAITVDIAFVGYLLQPRAL
jgi:hypothetical protein